MHDFNPGQLRERMDSMHAIEKSADEVRHDMMDELVTAFITPFDREDIDELGHVLDDVTDSIEGVLNRMYYDNVTDMRDDAVRCRIWWCAPRKASASWSTNCRDSGIQDVARTGVRHQHDRNGRRPPVHRVDAHAAHHLHRSAAGVRLA